MRTSGTDRRRGTGRTRLPASSVAALAGALATALLAPAVAAAATIEVTTTADVVADDGACSLREAVNSANANNSSGVLPGECPAGDADPTLDTVALAGSGATYALAGNAADPADDNNASGDFDILAGGPLEIVGHAPGETIIDGAGVDRLIHIPFGAVALKLSGLTLEGGLAKGGGNMSGGAIYITGGSGDSHVTVEDVVVAGNASPTGGGGIALQQSAPPSTLTVIDSEIASNSADGTLGGGGVLAAGPVAITGSSIHGNSSDSPDNFIRGGGGIKASGELIIADSTISGNSAGDGDLTIQDNLDNGGGIAFVPSGPAELTITDSTISDNSTEQFGGGLYATGSEATVTIEGSTFEGNSVVTEEANRHTAGGAIYNASSTIEITGSLLTSNHAKGGPGGDAEGGAIRIEGYLDTTTTISESLFDGNFVTVLGAASANGRGGALFSAAEAETRVEATSLNGNFAIVAQGAATVHGGAMAADFDSSTAVVNSTIAGNSALFGGAATGGGIQQFGAASIDVVNSTIAGNSSSAGPGLHRIGASGEVTLRGTIIDQGPAACVADAGVFTSGDYNLDAGASCIDGTATGDLTNADPLLEPLADNGGPRAGSPADDLPIPTMALPETGSPAVDQIPEVSCTDLDAIPLTTDQRGFPRPSPTAGDCDLGAFELTQADPPPTTGPSNDFTFVKVRRKPRRGVAILVVKLPGPGDVALRGRGLKPVNRTVAGGRAKLKLMPGRKGRSARKLRNRLATKGKARVRAKVTYAPIGGSAKTKVKRLRLVRR